MRIESERCERTCILTFHRVNVKTVQFTTEAELGRLDAKPSIQHEESGEPTAVSFFECFLSKAKEFS